MELHNATTELDVLVQSLADPAKRNETFNKLKNYISNLENQVKNDQNADLYVLIGRAHFYLEEDPLAIESFSKAFNLDPNNSAAHFWRGLIARYNQDTATAALHFEKATSLAPNASKYWYELGQLYAGDMKDAEKGLKAFEECVKHDPKHSQAHYQIGSIAASSHQNEKAIEHLKQATELNPAYINAYFNLGQIYQLTKEHEKAIECFLRVLELAPNDWQARSKLIQLNYALHRETEALQQRQIMFELWRQGHVKAPRFCREQIDLNGYKVIVYEYFTLEGQGSMAMKYDCHVTKDEKVQFRFSCGSYDMTNSFFMEMNSVDGKTGQRAYHFDGYYPGGTHKTFGFHTGEPSYQQVRDKLIEVVGGHADVLSSFTPQI
jgi:tetratricopeptide (TPR) repeat protein